jgi:hypothetical protein
MTVINPFHVGIKTIKKLLLMKTKGLSVVLLVSFSSFYPCIKPFLAETKSYLDNQHFYNA